MLFETFLFLLFVGLIYYLAFNITSKEIRKGIQDYEENSMMQNGVVDGDIVWWIDWHKEEIIILGSIAWPIYYLFILGASIGQDLFDKLVEDNYENRIATWFI